MSESDSYAEAAAIVDLVRKKATEGDYLRLPRAEMLALAQVYATLAQVQATVMLADIAVQSHRAHVPERLLGDLREWKAIVGVAPSLE